MMGDSAYRGTHGTSTSLDHSPAIIPQQGNAAMARVTDPWCWRVYRLPPQLETVPASPPVTSLPFLLPQGRGIVRVAQRAGADPDTTKQWALAPCPP